MHHFRDRGFFSRCVEANTAHARYRWICLLVRVVGRKRPTAISLFEPQMRLHVRGRVLATHTSGQKTPLYGSSRGRSVVASVTAVGPWLTSYEEDQQFRGSFPDYWIEQLRSRERGCGLSCDR